MAMDGLLVFACALLTSSPPAVTTPASGGKLPSAVENALAVQNAMRVAGDYLQGGDARSAVLVLEDQLPRINGSRKYLELMASAYRKFIKDLSLSGRPEDARKYLERLCILEPEAARDRLLLAETPTASPTARSARAPAAQPVKKDFTARAKSEDPFDSAYENKGVPAAKGERKPAAAPEKKQPLGEPAGARQAVARGLVERALTEFGKERFAEARVLFEEAHRADQKTAGKHADQWAYCKLHQVVEKLNQGREGSLDLADLAREIRSAVAMSPRLEKTGTWLLQEVDDRRNGAGSKTEKEAELNVAVQHYEGKNAQGWRVAETASFRIFHNQPRELVDRAARVAEQTRLAMQRKWLGRPEADWSPKCTIYLHADGKEYQHFTGVPATSPGHSRMEIDGDRVVSRRVDVRCDNPGMLTAILPHEMTHVVLAGHFGKHHVPRWADEGMAVLTEPKAKLDLHRKNLTRCRTEGQLFDVGDLMRLDDYPQPRRVGAFYAQSVSLVDFLAREKGPETFTRFVRDALADGYEPALRKHYRFRSFDELQETWSRHVFGSSLAHAAGTSGQDR
jgi:hypothetical protein